MKNMTRKILLFI